MTRKATGRRLNGDGSVYWRENRQRWVAEFTTDYGTPNFRKTTRLFKTQREAVRYLADLRRKVERGLPVADNKIEFGQWLDYWLELIDASPRRLSTKSNYRENARLHVIRCLGSIKLAELRHEHVHRFLVEKRDQNYSKSSLKLFRTIASLAFDQAVLEDKIARNVARDVVLPHARPPRKVASWTAEEAQRFLAAARNDRLFAAYVLLAMVGLRKGEVLALSWDDYDPQQQTLRIRRQVQRVKGTKKLIVVEPKSVASARIIHLPRQAAGVLDNHRDKQATQRAAAGSRWQDHNLMFTTEKGTHIDPRNFNNFMVDLCRRAGIESLADEARTPHSLRHTAATVARALGVDWKDIQAMLGHSSIKITMDIYVDVTPELQRVSAELIDSGFRLDEELSEGSMTANSRPNHRPTAMRAFLRGLSKSDTAWETG